MGLLLAVIILALPWAYAFAQRPRVPFIYGALVGGAIGAVALAWLASQVDFLSVEFGLVRSALAALIMGGPLGSLLGQAVVALFVRPRPRRTGAAVGLLVGPLLGWPPIYLFPAGDPRLWHGPYWIAFWLGSWAGWTALLGAVTGVWSQSWSWAAKRVFGIALLALVLPAITVGAWNFDAIRLHATAVHDLEAKRDVEGLVWKLDHGEEVPEAVRALGRVCEGMDPAVEARLAAILDGSFTHMPGETRSDPEYMWARAEAAEALGRIGDTRAVNILLRYATDPDPAVRRAVTMALTRNRRSTSPAGGAGRTH